MAVRFTPWMGSIVMTNANQPYQLSALLINVATNAPAFSNVASCQTVALQADPEGGSARFYIGNSSLSATNFGVVLFATQVWPIYSMDSNLIRLDHIYVMSDTAGLNMGVTFLTR